MDIVVAGASGFVGHRLVPALLEAGHHVRALSRHPEETDEAELEQVFGDVSDGASLKEPLCGADLLIYLVHSLGDDDFEDLDAEAAWATAHAAKEAGIGRIIYLGGLGDDDAALSQHLRSRREVEGILGATGIPVTVLRAGIVVGHQGISWEITRQLVLHLPAMIAPRWVSTRSQPIAVDDVVRYVVGLIGLPETAGETYDIGGPDVLTYKEMLQETAVVMGRRRPPIVPVPLLTPGLSARWLRFVTDVDTSTAASLIESMTNEVVVRDDAITRVLPMELISFRDAVSIALDDRAMGT
jgi:uncharacterized protein YbjT (DUF2867 family)